MTGNFIGPLIIIPSTSDHGSSSKNECSVSRHQRSWISFFNMGSKMAFSAKANIVIHATLDHFWKEFENSHWYHLKLTIFQDLRKSILGKQQQKQTSWQTRQERFQGFGLFWFVFNRFVTSSACLVLGWSVLELPIFRVCKSPVILKFFLECSNHSSWFLFFSGVRAGGRGLQLWTYTADMKLRVPQWCNVVRLGFAKKVSANSARDTFLQEDYCPTRNV